MPPTSDPARRQTASPQTPQEESPQKKSGIPEDSLQGLPGGDTPQKKCKGWRGRWVAQTKTREVRSFGFLGRRKHRRGRAKLWRQGRKQDVREALSSADSATTETPRHKCSHNWASPLTSEQKTGGIHGTVVFIGQHTA